MKTFFYLAATALAVGFNSPVAAQVIHPGSALSSRALALASEVLMTTARAATAEFEARRSMVSPTASPRVRPALACGRPIVPGLS